MADVDETIWTPQVEKRFHPVGEKGVITSLEAVAERVAKGATSPKVRMWAIECLDRARKERGWKMDTEKERATVLLEACQQKLWVPDPIGVEWMAGAHLMACDADKDGVCFRGNDCFPVGTLLLAEGHELVPIEKVRPGMKVWGLDRWSEVQAVEYKGILPIDVVTLNNGSEVKLTPDHHVYVLDCQKHPMLDDEEDARALPEDRHWRGGGADDRRWGCSCDAEHRVEKRCRVSELREGMALPTPERIPFGTESMDPDRAYIEGLYVSDGWADYHKNNHFSISGQDGCPKEEQKREVQEACERLGVNTSWMKKSIAVRDKEWTLRVQQMGRYAPEKHLLSINLDEAAAAPTLRGVMADSGANTRGPSRTFTTTSRELAIQTRLLHKMFGVQCGWRYIENHGGLGENPIYRLGQRGREATAAGHKPWSLRVKKIEREVISVPCWDIQTDDHRVYLAEHDVTVSQCDDLVILLGSCFSSVGIYTAVVGHAYDREKNISHVLTSAWVNGKWTYADPSTDLPLGECVKFTRERIYAVPSGKMICDANICFTHPRRFDPERNDFVGDGSFVGVSGPPSTKLPDIEGAPQFAWLAEPRREVRWLGQTNADEEHEKAAFEIERGCYNLQASPCAKRICQQIINKRGGTSDEDIESYVKTGAACGAEAACAAVGLEAAAPICGRIGEAVANVFYGGAKEVVNKIKGLFNFRKNKAKKRRKTIEAIHDLFGEMSEWLEDIEADQIEATALLHDLLSDALELYNDTSPVHNLTKMDLAMKLSQLGLPMATSWRPWHGITNSVTNGTSQFIRIGMLRNQERAAQLTDRYDMILSPEWDVDLGIAMSEQLDWGTLPYKDALDFVEDAYPRVMEAHNRIHDEMVAWLAKLDVAGAALMAYVAEGAAKNAALQAVEEQKEMIPRLRTAPKSGLLNCKTRQQAQDARYCLDHPDGVVSAGDCASAPRHFYEYVDALPFCEGELTPTERDLIELAEAMAEQEKRTTKKKYSALPMVVFAAAAASLAWWAL